MLCQNGTVKPFLVSLVEEITGDVLERDSSRNLLITPFKSRHRPGQVPGTSDASRAVTLPVGVTEQLRARNGVRPVVRRLYIGSIPEQTYQRRPNRKPNASDRAFWQTVKEGDVTSTKLDSNHRVEGGSEHIVRVCNFR